MTAANDTSEEYQSMTQLNQSNNNTATSKYEDCTILFVVFELIIANIPMILFVITGFCNFRKVKESGFNRILGFTTFTKFKLALCILAGLLNFAIILIAMIRPDWIDNTGNYGLCLEQLSPLKEFSNTENYVKSFICTSRVLAIVAWAISYKLLVYLYRKGFSEFWYSHKMFWSLNAICTLISTIWQAMAVAFESELLLYYKIGLIVINITLLILMVRTKERSVKSPRPGIRIQGSELIYEDKEQKRKRTTSFGHLKHTRSNESVIEPRIEVSIAPRTKEHFSEDYKIFVNYRALISKEEQLNLKNLKKWVNVPKEKKKGENQQIQESASEISLEGSGYNQNLLNKDSNKPPDMKTVNIKLVKNIQQILVLHDQVKDQFQINSKLIQFIHQEKNLRGSIAESQKDQFATIVKEDELYPKIDNQTLIKITHQVQQFPTNKNYTAGGQTKYVNVTQIFNEETQNIIQNIQKFFSAVVQDKMYWNRKILEFFGVEERDINVFLSMHEQYKADLFDRFKSKMLSSSYAPSEPKQRSESYYRSSGLPPAIIESYRNSNDGDMLMDPMLKQDTSIMDDSRSFHMDMNRIQIKDNYLYGTQTSNSESESSQSRHGTKTRHASFNMDQSKKDRLHISQSKQEEQLSLVQLRQGSSSLRKNFFSQNFSKFAEQSQGPDSVRGKRNNSFDETDINKLLNRPLFRIQIKRWENSNSGDYIEYHLCVQTLEGSRRSWFISKRYTDFVKLHDSLAPIFKIQINPKKCITTTDKVLPILPLKISGQSAEQLNLRLQQLQVYVDQMLKLMNGQVQFNQIMLKFIGFQQYASPNPTRNFKTEISNLTKQSFSDGISSEFFDIEKYFLSAETTEVKLISHQIKLDQNKRPKVFYMMQVLFLDRKDKIKKEKAQAKNNYKKNNSKKIKEPSIIKHSIKLEKVYGDFKRLHEHVVESFQNEISEYQKIKQMIESPQHLMVHEINDRRYSQNLISLNIDVPGDSSKQEQQNGITLHQGIKEEFERYGPVYAQEANRIVTSLPKFPKKIWDDHQFGSPRVYKHDEGNKVNPDQLMEKIEDYMNELLQFSPLITNMFYVRDFLTINRSKDGSNRNTNMPLQFDDRHKLSTNSINQTQEIIDKMEIEEGANNDGGMILPSIIVEERPGTTTQKDDDDGNEMFVDKHSVRSDNSFSNAFNDYAGALPTAYQAGGDFKGFQKS